MTTTIDFIRATIAEHEGSPLRLRAVLGGSAALWWEMYGVRWDAVIVDGDVKVTCDAVPDVVVEASVEVADPAFRAAFLALVLRCQHPG